MQKLDLRPFPLLLLPILLLCACGDTETKDTAMPTGFTGTVQYIDLEGGFYGIITDEGVELDPCGLPQSMQINGLRIQGVYVLIDDAVGFHMWGALVELTEVDVDAP